jgi:hypothetical protein
MSKSKPMRYNVEKTKRTGDDDEASRGLKRRHVDPYDVFFNAATRPYDAPKTETEPKTEFKSDGAAEATGNQRNKQVRFYEPSTPPYVPPESEPESEAEADADADAADAADAAETKEDVDAADAAEHKADADAADAEGSATAKSDADADTDSNTDADAEAQALVVAAPPSDPAALAALEKKAMEFARNLMAYVTTENAISKKTVLEHQFDPAKPTAGADALYDYYVAMEEKWDDLTTGTFPLQPMVDDDTTYEDMTSEEVATLPAWEQLYRQAHIAYWRMNNEVWNARERLRALASEEREPCAA